jgi:hypothetical protein
LFGEFQSLVAVLFIHIELEDEEEVLRLEKCNCHHILVVKYFFDHGIINTMGKTSLSMFYVVVWAYFQAISSYNG